MPRYRKNEQEAKPMTYKSDIEIAQACEMRPIGEIAAKAHVDETYI